MSVSDLTSSDYAAIADASVEHDQQTMRAIVHAVEHRAEVRTTVRAWAVTW